MIKKNTPFIVAIGASAGGLETLKTFFLHSEPNESLAYVIVTHLSPGHVSILPELLQQFTSMKVLSIENQQAILGNQIYVLPPGKKISIHQGILESMDRGAGADNHLPIDFFLTSLAKDQGPKAICIILSGMGHDGTIGLRSLREHGGLIIAQIAKSARYDSMPKSAINTGLVDYVFMPEEMYSFLVKYLLHVEDKSIQIENSLSDKLQMILKLIEMNTGHDFSLYKSSTIFRRIQKRIDLLQLNSLSDYVHYLQQHPLEISILFGELLINVTKFFRDQEAFELLKTTLLERLLSRPLIDNTIRVWVPGCASGEEAYSIAIVLEECMRLLNRRFIVQIFGTDIDKDAIETARLGVFPSSIEKDVFPERLQHFFVKEAGFYKINPDIRKMIIFAVQNVIQDPSFTKLDLLSCRNLFIYLKPTLQKRVLPLFHYSLKTSGLLFLGPSENIGGAIDCFNIIEKKWKIYERKAGSIIYRSTMGHSRASLLSETIHVHMGEKMTQEPEPNLDMLIKNMLLKNYMPACVVIDEAGLIMYTYGRTAAFLELASGAARLRFIDMVRSELKSKLNMAIPIALTQRKEIILDKLQIKENDEFKYIRIKIKPINKLGFEKLELLLIIFEEIEPPQTIPVLIKKLPKKEWIDKTIAKLEQELKYTKENLQSTIEELETTNEELKSSNEELQSTNEELQSTNEEIETSKEELQSLNEELTTVNAELESRIDQLSSANDDIRNLLDNTEVATIFLDKNLCIKRFTPKATEIINLIRSDVGRPINHIVSNLQYDNLVNDARMVLKTLDSFSTASIDKNGEWYMIRIIPYRTVTNLIDGVVVSFMNIQEQKKAESKVCWLEDNLNTFKEIFNTHANPMVILDKKLKIMFANQSFVKQFKLKNVNNQSIETLGLEWDMDGIKQLVDHLLRSDALDVSEKIKIAPGIMVKMTMHKMQTSELLLTMVS